VTHIPGHQSYNSNNIEAFLKENPFAKIEGSYISYLCFDKLSIPRDLTICLEK
jgi:hypothetical protein